MLFKKFWPSARVTAACSAQLTSCGSGLGGESEIAMTLGSTPVGARNTIGGFCFPSDSFLMFEARSSGAASLVEEYPDWSPITFFLDWFDLLRSVIKLVVWLNYV